MTDLRETINSEIEESYLARLNNIELSFDLINNALKLSKENNFEDLTAHCFSKLSLYNMIIGKYDESFNFSQKV